MLAVYYVGPGLASKIAYVGAYFFSYIVNFSLNSTAYALDFLGQMWTVVRDLANMAFVFILIYISIQIMLRSETAGTVKMLAAVIVVALLVNFSFFFTRVAIDAGNIVAVQIYNAIPYGSNPSTAVIGNSGVKDLSVSLMDSLKVQSLLSTENFKKIQTLSDGAGGISGKSAGVIMYIFIFLFAAAAFWLLFFVFLQVGIKFLLRIVGLWVVLIASPAAFIAAAIPDPSVKSFFKMWYVKLFQYSVYPAIFLFMFFILTKFVTSMLSQQSGGNILAAIFNPSAGAATDANAQLGFLNVTAGVGIRLAFMMALLYIGLKVADMVVKEGSVIAGKVTGWTTGRVFGVGAGVAGWTARKSLGRGFNALAKSPNLAAAASKSGLKGAPFRGIERFSKFLGGATYDVRNAPGSSILKKGIEKTLGISPNTGKAVTEGYAQSSKAREEKVAREKRERAAVVRDDENKKKLGEIAERLAAGGTATAADEQFVSKLNKRELEAMSADHLGKVAALLTEDQVKRAQEMDKLTDKEKQEIKDTWEVRSKHAPASKAQKSLDDLAPLTNEPEVVNALVPGRVITKAITDQIRDKMKDILDDMKAEQRDKDLQLAALHNNPAATAAQKRTARQELGVANTMLRNAQRAVDLSEELHKEREKISNNASGTGNAKEFVKS